MSATVPKPRRHRVNIPTGDTHTAAIVPLFLDTRHQLAQLGSAVAIVLCEQLVLLTAAHVSDAASQGTICCPTNSGILPIHGCFGQVRIARNIARNKDKYDVSYFRPTSKFAALMHESICPLRMDELRLNETLLENDIYTFSGYPASKSKVQAHRASSEVYSYSGSAASPAKFERLGYNLDDHILVNFDRRTSVDPRGVHRVPPHPRGISGGGVFAWPKDVFDNPKTSIERKLVGIGHTYLKTARCLVGTRIGSFLSLIAANHPELFESPDIDKATASIPLFTALIWYRREDWDDLMSDFRDADKYHTSWNEWRQAYETSLDALSRNQRHLVPIELTRDEIRDYCREQGRPNDSSARTKLANRKLVAQLREVDL